MTSNRLLAEQARALADGHPGGSLPRRAWACVGVVLATTNTVTAARKALEAVRLDDVRAAAVERLDQLARQEHTA